MSDNVNVHVIYKVHGGTVRCEALATLLRDKLGHGAVTAGSADRAVAYVRDVIAIAQSTLQPEACRPGTDWRGNNFDHLGKATVVVVGCLLYHHFRHHRLGRQRKTIYIVYRLLALQ